MTLQRDAETAAAELERITRIAVDALAVEHSADNAAVFALVRATLWRRLNPADMIVDNRARRFLIHAAIYDARKPDEPRWDSRTAAPEGYTIAGLPSVYTELLDTAKAWHASQGHLDDGGHLIGLNTCERAVRGLRPTLSRHWTTELAKAKREGRPPVPQSAKWRLQYQTFDKVGGKNSWIIRCDLTPLKED